MEQLLILDQEAAAGTRRRIERMAKVVQERSERLLVVDGTEGALRKIALPGVSTLDRLSADTAKQLSSGEQMFLAAWRKQARMATKKRAGQGLSWSAKGYRPP